ncbi:trypsin-1-like [Rhynchophorus ferrugineus]|uniref:trypsin-1-like n=1 Tax=Rhynchophorus ferrugineus TaxID=354439 RepID=UPI003FCD6DC8
MKLIAAFCVLTISTTFGEDNFKPSYYPLNSAQKDIPPLKIAHGHNAVRNQFPYQVSVRRHVITSYYHICGGSILNKNFILTAAHCTSEFPPNYFRIVAGILDTRDIGIPNQQTIAVSSIIDHPNYDENVSLSPYDISILQLSTPLSYGVNVQPISLPAARTTPHGYAVVSGWGRTANNDLPDILQYVEVPIATARECIDLIYSISGAINGFYADLTICVVPRTPDTGEATCSGDSGGPLVQNNEVVGIVSWGYSPCGYPGIPSVLTKVSVFVDWIRSTIETDNAY